MIFLEKIEGTGGFAWVSLRRARSVEVTFFRKRLTDGVFYGTRTALTGRRFSPLTSFFIIPPYELYSYGGGCLLHLNKNF